MVKRRVVGDMLTPLFASTAKSVLMFNKARIDYLDDRRNDGYETKH